MSKLLGKRDSLEVDGFLVRREERSVRRDDGGGAYTSKVYLVTRHAPQ